MFIITISTKTQMCSRLQTFFKTISIWFIIAISLKIIGKLWPKKIDNSLHVFKNKIYV